MKQLNILFKALMLVCISTQIMAQSAVNISGFYNSRYTLPPEMSDDIVAISGLGYGMMALKSDGTVITTGQQVGPVPPEALYDVKAIAWGNYVAGVVKTDGTVIVWGNAAYGSMEIPSEIQGKVVSLTAGKYSFVALTSDGAAYSWGRIGAAPAAASSDIVKVDHKHMHALALKSDGTVVAWGTNSHGESTPPDSLQGRITDIATGVFFSGVVYDDGKYTGWGYTYYPLHQAPASTVGRIQKLSIGESYVAALLDDQTIATWGGNQFGQRNIPSAYQGRYMDVHVGWSTTLAILCEQLAINQIYGDQNACANSVNYYSTDYIEGATYEWTVSSGAEIVSGQGTHEVGVSMNGASISSVRVRGTSPDGCPGNWVYKTVRTVAPNYYLESVQPYCTSDYFEVPVLVNSSLEEKLSLEVCLSYDAEVMEPSGNITFGDGVDASQYSYHLTYPDSNKVKVGIYFSGTVFPTYIAGSGKLFDIEFMTLTDQAEGDSSEVALCGIWEGGITGRVNQCGELPATIAWQSQSTFTGTVTYAGKTGSNGQMTGPITVNGSASDCTVSGTSKTTDSVGKFTWDADASPALQLFRDIDNSTDVMAVIGGGDASLVRSFLSGTRNPNIYQAIASDVDMDSRITYLDLSLINIRTIGGIEEFNQPNLSTNRDWVFFPKSELTENPLFTISERFPAVDGQGYTMEGIPSIPTCYPIPTSGESTCFAVEDQEWVAVLLGDVNRNWSAATHGATMKTKSAPVILDLNRVEYLSDGYRVPVEIPFQTNFVDMKIQLEHGVDVPEMAYENDQVSLQFLQQGNELKITSYKEDAINGTLWMTIQSDQLPQAGIVGTAYLADGAVDVEVISEEQLTTSVQVETMVFSNGVLIGAAAWQNEQHIFLYDIQGKMLSQGAATSVLQQVSPGLYTVQWQDADNQRRAKLIVR